MATFLETNISFLKGVGPAKAKLLKEELGIATLYDLLHYYPFRHEDRSRVQKIIEISIAESDQVQIKGYIKSSEVTGSARVQRMNVVFADETGSISLVWFKGVSWIASQLKKGVEYVVYGKVSIFQNRYTISHPEMEILTPGHEQQQNSYVPIYATTEKLKKRYLDSKAIMKLEKELLAMSSFEVVESVDTQVRQEMQIVDLNMAVRQIHFPKDRENYTQALNRLKFDELFFIQLKIFQSKNEQLHKYQGLVFTKSHLVETFYHHHLPFDLTHAQKRVIKEIYADLKSGRQMNRLLQGDVGSGKTITAFVCMLIAISSGYQTAIMAPTEILAMQHLGGLKAYGNKIGINVQLVTGSTKKKARKIILEQLIAGEVHILVGTHALIQDDILFKKLGLVVVDEQHRFGVAQRAKLWQKNKSVYPHLLVMTATPIPRTLAMTLYGDLEMSTIDELPKGRKPIKTSHLYDTSRSKLFGFIRRQIDEGYQVYIVYPLIEASSVYDFKDLMDGYESIARAFPTTPLSILHGKMKPADKEFEMNRFVKGETKIMVATTVIEVGVNVPNASVMVIENSERFGLSQLHQLRGRVGRGADQSYCILMTGSKLSNKASARVNWMVATTDGFEIAEKDLEIRGPGDLMGTQQSGLLDLKIADLSTDGALLKMARQKAQEIIANDPNLLSPKHSLIKARLAKDQTTTLKWSAVS